MRIVFFGTPEFAVPTLERLAQQPRFTVTAAVTQPDRPAGRGGAVQPAAVKRAAERLGVAVYQPERMREAAAVAWLRAQQPEVLVVVAFGQLLPPAVFEMPRWGAINAHGSLLPAYRGAAPIQWAIANGETRTGVTTMRINAGLDTGDMLLQRAVPIGPDVTAPALAAELAVVAADLMIATLDGLAAGTLEAHPQPEGASLAPRLTREAGRVRWEEPAQRIYDRWRGFQPWPGIYTTWRGKKLAILRCRPALGAAAAPPGTLVEQAGGMLAACGDGLLRLERVQVEGKREVEAEAFARGAHVAWGEERLESAE